MLDLAVNGYTAEQVMDCLHGRSGSRGKVTFRYDLLSKEDVKLGELQAQPGRVTLNSLAEIKRTAVFQITEQEGKDIDWLSDRIRPVFCLKMPEIRKTYKAWGKIDASFSRSSIAYLSNGTQVAANVPRFEQGKFGKAVMVEKGTENLVDINNFTFANGASLVDIVHPVTGKTVKAIKLPQGANTPVSYSQYLNLSTSTNYTVSFDLWASDNSNAAINIDLFPDTLPEMWEKPTTSVQRHVWTLSSSSADMGNCQLRFFDNTSQPMPNDVYIAMIQLEQKPYATSFIDGTRAAETLEVPTEGALNPQEGTVECWVYVDGVVRRDIVGNWPTVVLIRKGTSVANWIWLYHEGGNWALQIRKEDGTVTGWGSFNDSLTPDGWHYFAIRWNAQAGTADVFLNGVKRASLTDVAFPAEYDRIEIGHRSGSSDDWLNSLIDDLRISNRARTDAEILAAYQSGQPAPIDEWTTAKFDFDNRLTGEYFTIVNDSKPVQWIEWPLGVFLLSSPTRKDENRKVKRSIEAYDSSLILKEDKFTDRYIVAAGTKYTEAIIDILNAAGIWKINIIDHPGTLATDREFEIGTSKLTAINELLAAINYTSLWVDENGYFVAQPYVLPSNRDPEYEYRTDDLSIIHPGGTEELDLFGVPNKWVRYVSNPDRAVILRSEYVNDLSTSPTSTVNRGRTIVDIDSVEDIYDQATLDEYVKRIAYNASQVYGKFEFATALMPHHSYYNCLFVKYDPLGISHKYMESSWTMDLQPGGVMTHSCRRVINI